MPGKQAATLLRRAVCVVAVLGLGMPAWAQATDGGSAGAAGQPEQAASAQPGSPGAEQPGVSAQPDENRLREQAGQPGMPDRAQRDQPGALDRAQRDQDRQPGAMDRARHDQQRSSAMPGQARGEQDWIRVGYDFDDDGQFDSFDYIPAQELDRIRSASADQPGRLRGTPAGRDMNQRSRQRQLDYGQRQTRFGQRPWESDRQSFGSQQIQGRVISTSSMDVRNREHLIAQIETQDNRRVQVDLGPRDQIRDRIGRLQEGDRITVTARQSDFHDEALLVANRLEIDGQVINLQPQGRRFAQGDTGQYSQDMQPLNGEIVSMRLARYAGFDHDNVLACVQTDDGNVELVDLGPAHNLQQFDLALGNYVSLNARHGIINNQFALIAEEVETPGGRFAQLDNFGIEEPFQLRGTPVGPADEFQERDSDRFRKQDQYYRENQMRQDRLQQYERGLDRQEDRMMDRDRSRVWQRDQDRSLQRDESLQQDRSLDQDRIRDRSLERGSRSIEQDRLAPGEIESEMRRDEVGTEIERNRQPGEFERESESPRGEVESNR